VLLAFDLNLYIPISKNDENMQRAHERDAASKGKFWFRSHLAEVESTECNSKDAAGCTVHEHGEHFQEMTLLEILTGKGVFDLCLLWCDGATARKRSA